MSPCIDTSTKHQQRCFAPSEAHLVLGGLAEILISARCVPEEATAGWLTSATPLFGPSSRHCARVHRLGHGSLLSCRPQCRLRTARSTSRALQANGVSVPARMQSNFTVACRWLRGLLRKNAEVLKMCAFKTCRYLLAANPVPLPWQPHSLAGMSDEHTCLHWQPDTPDMHAACFLLMSHRW